MYCQVLQHDSPNLGQLSRHLLQPPVGSNTDVGEMQAHCVGEGTLNGLDHY